MQKHNIVQAKDIMQKNVIVMDTKSAIYDAIHLMVKHNITGLPVVNDSYQIIGIISEKDILDLLYHSKDSNVSIVNFMTRRVVCFDPDANLNQLAESFRKNDFRRIPIVHKDKLIGLVSRKDVIRYIAVMNGKIITSHSHNIRHCENRKSNFHELDKIMTTQVISVQQSATISDIVDILIENDITGIPVIETDNTLIGIITEKDIMSNLSDKICMNTTIADVMTRNIVSFDISESVMEVCEHVTRNHYRRVPITSKGTLVGIVSRRDLIRYIISPLDAKSTGIQANQTSTVSNHSSALLDIK